MKDNSGIFYAALAYESARSAVFGIEYTMFNAIQHLVPGSEKYRQDANLRTIEIVKGGLNQLLKQDARNIADGLYPIAVLKPESPLRHFTRLPRILVDGVRAYTQRARGRTAVFNGTARDYLSDVPRYYRRNFHFQSDGYLSGHSASLYEHQVEVLFGGGADAMRRLIIKPLKERFGDTDGQGLTFLEIGAGTGRSTRFVHLAFPKAKIVAIDLSDPYLKEAERQLSDLPRIAFMQADGGKLPFQDKIFDAAYSVFLYHELPLDARKAVIDESLRVLKPGGFLGLVDSIQQDDIREFNSLLESFPQNYHEPFYRNYIAHPMQALLKKHGLSRIGTDLGFLSKVCWGTKGRKSA